MKVKLQNNNGNVQGAGIRGNLTHQFKHLTKELWLFKTWGALTPNFRMTLSKYVKIMITWHFLITDNLEGTLEIADHLLARGITIHIR